MAEDDVVAVVIVGVVARVEYGADEVWTNGDEVADINDRSEKRRITVEVTLDSR